MLIFSRCPRLSKMATAKRILIIKRFDTNLAIHSVERDIGLETIKDSVFSSISLEKPVAPRSTENIPHVRNIHNNIASITLKSVRNGKRQKAQHSKIPEINNNLFSRHSFQSKFLNAAPLYA